MNSNSPESSHSDLGLAKTVGLVVDTTGISVVCFVVRRQILVP